MPAALDALEAQWRWRRDRARGRRRLAPMPRVEDFVCDGDILPDERRHSRSQPAKFAGVNLGGWMIVTPWVTPSLFYQFEGQPADGTAIDMHNFCRVLGPAEANRQLREHWRKWVTDDDLRRLAAQGVNSLRIPVADWMWDAHEPYSGCTNGSLVELHRVLRQCERHGLRVLIDMHGNTSDAPIHTSRTIRAHPSTRARSRMYSFSTHAAMTRPPALRSHVLAYVCIRRRAPLPEWLRQQRPCDQRLVDSGRGAL